MGTILKPLGRVSSMISLLSAAEGLALLEEAAGAAAGPSFFLSSSFFEAGAELVGLEAERASDGLAALLDAEGPDGLAALLGATDAAAVLADPAGLAGSAAEGAEALGAAELEPEDAGADEAELTGSAAEGAEALGAAGVEAELAGADEAEPELAGAEAEEAVLPGADEDPELAGADDDTAELAGVDGDDAELGDADEEELLGAEEAETELLGLGKEADGDGAAVPEAPVEGVSDGLAGATPVGWSADLDSLGLLMASEGAEAAGAWPVGASVSEEAGGSSLTEAALLLARASEGSAEAVVGRVTVTVTVRLLVEVTVMVDSGPLGAAVTPVPCADSAETLKTWPPRCTSLASGATLLAESLTAPDATCCMLLMASS